MKHGGSIWRGALTVPLSILFHKVVDSFWFVPGLLVLASLGLAWGTVGINATTVIENVVPLPQMTVSGARTVLATIAGAVMTVGGVVFSLTFVALSVTAQQLGPRIVLMVMRNRTTQFVLGAFTATFLHALIALTAAGLRSEGASMPSLAVYVSVALATGSFCLVIYFVHAIALHIQADAVVAVLARQLNKAIYAFALADGGRDEGDDGSDPGRSEEAAEKVRRQGDALLARRSGYVQTIDYEAVVALADESSCEIAFNAGPGDFVIAGAPLASVSGRKVDDELRDAICAQVGLGPHRTAAQRIDFELRALVEVALRALSPSLNDPYTALACVHHLAEAIALLMRRRASSPVHTGKPDGGMVYEKRRSFEEIVDMVFRPLLDASATSIIALKGIEGVLSTLHSIAATDDEKRVLDVHFEHVRHCLGVLDSARSD